jgi:uncharacterized protein (TIGR02270 family)
MDRPSHLPAQSPAQVSRLVNPTTLIQHAADGAFLWILRDRAVASPRYRMRNLLALDQRIEANREGLLLADEDGWAACRDGLASGDAGEIFAAAVVAFSTLRADRMRAACEVALAAEDGQRALIAALAWLPFEPLAPILQRLAAGADARLRRVALRAIGIHRQDPFDALQAALSHDDPGVVSAAARGLGECRRRDAVPLLLAHLDCAPPAARFSLACSLSLLGHREALALLAPTAEAGGVEAMAAVEVLLRALPLAQGRQMLSSLSGRPGRERLVIAGTGILGDPLAVPWLIAKMADPALCRIAGEAFSLITGADLEHLDLDRSEAGEDRPDEDEGDAEDRVHPDDQELPVPDPVRVEAWWGGQASSMPKGVRHLCGRPIAAGSLVEVLRHGYQRQRRAAALEWVLHREDALFFDVRQRSDGQQRVLRTCS